MKARLFLFATALAALNTAYRCLDHLTRGRPPEWLPVSLEQFTGCYCAFALYPLIRWASDRHHWRAYLAAVSLFSLLHTSLNWATRALAFPLAGLGPYDYGAMPLRYLMELPIDIIGFSVASYMRRLYLAWERSRALENQLAAARMDLLTRQLQPHFLFNALNTISALMHENIAQADRVLHRLSDFLRATTDIRATSAIPLAEELRLLDSYLAVMQARMESQLQVHLSVDPQAHSFLVPPLFLQPLVENAITHGRNPATQLIHLELTIQQTGQRLEGSLRDHGPGWQSTAPGFGLDAVRQRLTTLYGPAAELRCQNHPSGGALLQWSFPSC